jgi:hypothetical protein
MWNTLPLLAALSLAPTQAVNLELTNVRATYGLWGAVRDDKVLPGDLYLVAFTIEGISVSAEGKVRYSMGMEVRDSKNKIHYKRDPSELEAYNSLGGRQLPAFAHVEIPTDQPPGRYSLKISVTDLVTKRATSFERKFEVAEPAFGIVRFNLAGDPYARSPAPSVGVPGQTIWIHLSAVGFDLGANKNEPSIDVEARVFDENNVATVSKPIGYTTSGWSKETNLAPIAVPVSLNRTGKFTVKLVATDKITNKKAEQSLAITVLENK